MQNFRLHFLVYEQIKMATKDRSCGRDLKEELCGGPGLSFRISMT